MLSLNDKNAETVEMAPSPSSSSLTDSLTAVRNATQAAARIHQVFRAQSFQKKQLKEFGDKKLGMSEERALSMLAPKTHKSGRAHSDDSVQAAAIRIQNKFRGYKGRKDYLITRQRIIKIQVHKCFDKTKLKVLIRLMYVIFITVFNWQWCRLM